MSLSSENNNDIEFPFEIGHVNEKKLNENFADRVNINSLISSDLPTPTKSTFLLLFISEATSCGNCLNEINDYLEISLNDKMEYSFYKVLIYHSDDSLQTIRFSKASNFEGKVDHLAITNPNMISELKLAFLLPNYGVRNSLYLIDLQKNVIFHGFALPSGKTTRFAVKEAAFKNAIITYNNKSKEN